MKRMKTTHKFISSGQINPAWKCTKCGGYSIYKVTRPSCPVQSWEEVIGYVYE